MERDVDFYQRLENELLEVVSKTDIEDAVYELSFELVSDKIQEIEKMYGITDDDMDDGTTWYDNVREDAMCLVFEKIRNFVNNEKLN